MYSYFKKSSDHEEVRIMSRAGDISHEKNVAIWSLRFIIVYSPPFPSAAKKNVEFEPQLQHTFNSRGFAGKLPGIKKKKPSAKGYVGNVGGGCPHIEPG